jgi:hypothetical protein
VVAEQERLQPEEGELQRYRERVEEAMRLENWKDLGVKWLVQMYVQEPQFAEAFHRLYYHIYESQVQPPPEKLKEDFAISSGERVSNLEFWEYHFCFAKFDQEINSEWLFKLSPTVVTLLASREASMMNCSLNGKLMLLAALYAKLHQGKLRLKKDGLVVVQLLWHYLPLVLHAHDSFLELYLGCCLQLIVNYAYLRSDLLPQANELIMRLLTIQTPRIAHNPCIKQMVDLLLHKLSIVCSSSQHDHFKNAIIRAASRKNLITARVLPHFDQNFFRKSEVNLMAAIMGQSQPEEKLNLQGLVPALRSRQLGEWLGEHEE